MLINFRLLSLIQSSFLFFFNATSPPETSTLSLHDALPICCRWTKRWRRSRRSRESASIRRSCVFCRRTITFGRSSHRPTSRDRKSTRLNSSHSQISYAVFCLKKKKKKKTTMTSSNTYIRKTHKSDSPYTPPVSPTPERSLLIARPSPSFCHESAHATRVQYTS